MNVTEKEKILCNLLQISGCDDSKDADRWEDVLMLAARRYADCQENIGNNGAEEVQRIINSL